MRTGRETRTIREVKKALDSTAFGGRAADVFRSVFARCIPVFSSPRSARGTFRLSGVAIFNIYDVATAAGKFASNYTAPPPPPSASGPRRSPGRRPPRHSSADTANSIGLTSPFTTRLGVSSCEPVGGRRSCGNAKTSLGRDRRPRTTRKSREVPGERGPRRKPDWNGETTTTGRQSAAGPKAAIKTGRDHRRIRSFSQRRPAVVVEHWVPRSQSLNVSARRCNVGRKAPSVRINPVISRRAFYWRETAIIRNDRFPETRGVSTASKAKRRINENVKCFLTRFQQWASGERPVLVCR